MTEAQSNVAPPSRDMLGRGLEHICRLFALVGGSVLVGITVMSVVSIAGRALIGKPVPGDFELVQIGCAICVAAFLPWCQLQRGNIIVDFFTTRTSARAQAWLDVFGALLLAAVMAVVAWRTAVGTISVKASAETSMIMGFPIWIGYAAMVPGFALTAVVACYTAYESWRGDRS